MTFPPMILTIDYTVMYDRRKFYFVVEKKACRVPISAGFNETGGIRKTLSLALSLQNKLGFGSLSISNDAANF